MEHETENYDRISEEEIRNVVQKEKTNKKPKRKMTKYVSLIVDDEEFVYKKKDMLIDKKNKSNVGQPVKIMSNSEEQSEMYKGKK